MNQFSNKREAIRLNDLTRFLVDVNSNPGGVPCTVAPRVEGLTLDDISNDQLKELKSLVAEFGAILLRGYRVGDAQRFGRLISNLSESRSEYREPATPRTQVHGDVFTSTEYPRDQYIPLHNENSHCVAWPRSIFFYCHTPPESRGATPIADCAKVLDRLSKQTREKFEKHHIRYTRRFGGVLGFDWRKVFGLNSPADIESYCSSRGMSYSWSDEVLSVSYTRNAIHPHPVHGFNLWFNHGLIFHASSVPKHVAEELNTQGLIKQLPFETTYGNGEPIESDTVDEIQRAYRAEMRTFTWQQNDVLILDNMWFAHGREPFTGGRKVLVGMADDYRPAVLESDQIASEHGV